MRLISQFHAEQFSYFIFETLKELISSLKQDEIQSRLHTMLINTLRRIIARSGQAPQWPGDTPNIIDVEYLYSLHWDAHKLIRKYEVMVNDHQNPYIIEHAKEQLEGCEKALRKVHDAFQSIKKMDFIYTDPTYKRFLCDKDFMEVRESAYDWLSRPTELQGSLALKSEVASEVASALGRVLPALDVFTEENK